MLLWYYLALVSSVLVGFATLIEKATLKAEHAMAYSASFSILTAIISLLFLPLASFNIGAMSLLLIVVTSVITALTFWLTARVYRHGSVATTSSVYTALPILFVTIFAFLFLKGEQLAVQQYIAIGVLILATYLILFREKTGFRKEKYVYTLIIASILSAASIIILKYVLQTVNTYTYLVLSNIFIAAFMMVLMQVEHGGLSEIISNMSRYRMAVLSTSVLAIAYRMTFYVAATLAPISLVWPVRNVPNILIVVFTSGILFGERYVWRKALLAIIMLISVYFMLYAA